MYSVFRMRIFLHGIQFSAKQIESAGFAIDEMIQTMTELYHFPWNAVDWNRHFIGLIF